MPDPKVIVLTGVSRGLGLAMTEGFIERGHIVHGCARSKDHIEALRARFGAPHTFTQVDVRNNGDVAAWSQLFDAKNPPPDLLINNAAIINPNAELWKIEPEDFRAILEINVLGVYHMIRHFAPRMVARGTGVIINFSSGWGRSTSPEVAPYNATKFAIEGLSKALAQELPPGMASIPLNPGIIDTDMLRSCFSDGAASYPRANTWAENAVPYILSLGPQNNGESLSVPN